MDTTGRSRRGGQGKAIAAGFVLFLVALLAVWWWSSQQLPVVTVPKPTLPNPNAFNTYLEAAALQLESNKVGDAVSSVPSRSKGAHEYTWAEKEKLVAENAPVLKKLRQGLDQDYMSPPMRSFSALFPYFAQDRSMARLLSLESRVRAHRGDYGGAARSNTDAIELGAQIPHGSVLIGGLVGIACEAIGRRGLWEAGDHLDAPQARATIQRLERVRHKHFPFYKTMQEEKWLGQAGLLEMMSKPNFAAGLGQATGSTMPTVISGPIGNMFFLVYSKRRIMNDYTQYMDAEIARAKLPYGSTPPTIVPNDPIVQILTPVFDQARQKSEEGAALNNLVETVLALRVYRLEHGQYPDSLSALVPSILPQVLDDPFASGAPLRYRRIGRTYVLYSIGPDGKDDHGTAIDTKDTRSGNPNARYQVQADSKGDIVAGTNR